MTDAPALPPRLPVTPAEIDRVVASFYRAVRADPVLGPVFAAHVTDWPAHEAKIAAFWRNAIFADRGYAGSPMRAHLLAGNVKPAHFAHWLGLFDSVLDRELDSHAARGWSALAHRIGAGLRLGLVESGGGPPTLR